MRLANKCLSVMKVNTLAPEATFQDYWSTPDRVPHRNLWLWDSVFHAVAMTHIDPTLAWYFLKSVLDMHAEDGMIPISGSAEGGRAPGMTQPPLLAWGVWANYQATRNPAQLAYAFPRLEAYLRWNLENRDANGNGLLEWDIEEDELCRSGESGMDNSPRFDDALLLDAVDFSTFQAHDMLFLGKIAAELGHAEQAQFWEAQAAKMSQQIFDVLWSEEHGIYLDRPLDDITIAPVAASSGFLPLLLPDIPSAHAERLTQTLRDPSRFWSALPRALRCPR
jgi:glycogen debranching enzyme